MSRGFREKAAEPGDIRTGFQRERLGGSPSPGETPAGAAAALAGPRGVPGIRGRGPGGLAGSKAADADAGAVYPAAFKRVWGPLCLHFCVKH